jgi:hypothetical protein
LQPDIDPDDFDWPTKFEPYDIYKLIGFGLIAWAAIISLSVPLFLIRS